MIAEMTGFSGPLIAEARRIQRVVRELYPILIESNSSSGNNSVGAALLALLQQLLLLQNSAMRGRSSSDEDDAALRQYLGLLRAQISESDACDMLALIEECQVHSL